MVRITGKSKNLNYYQSLHGKIIHIYSRECSGLIYQENDFAGAVLSLNTILLP